MKIIILTSLLSILFSTTALAKNHYAKVIRVEPVYKYLTISTPREICHRQLNSGRHHSSANTVIGAIIGGTIGNAISHNNRNGNITTVAGALIGGAIGHQLGHQNKAERRTSQHCVTSYEQTKKIRKLKGYNVLYRFHGKTYKTFSKQRPGKKIIVRNKTRAKVHASHYHDSH
jgi:uncharacterized protein YcfJ